jgi:hypothetical protein
MTRNQIILIAGIVVIGAIGFAGYKIIQKAKADKLAKETESSTK